MSDTRYFAGVLSLALLAGSFAAAADTRAQADSKVQKVLVRGSGEALEVEIQTSGAAVAPDTQAITGPDRIVVDFPGALPSSELHALQVNQGQLKSIRAGLFSNNPPTTRIVLDLTGPRAYQVSTSQNAVVVKLGSGGAAATVVHAQKPAGSGAAASNVQANGVQAKARLQNAALVSGPAIPSAAISSAKISSATISIVRVPVTQARPVAGQVPNASQASLAQTNASQPSVSQQSVSQQSVPPVNRAQAAIPPVPPQVASQPPAAAAPPQPTVDVSYQNGLLSIHSDKASLSQVLFEVHVKTQADIAIPAGAEQEQVVANLGPAPAKDVLAALLNGSTYNFIFVGDERVLERVIISRKDPNLF